MVARSLSDRVADLAMERVAGLLGRVADAVMKAGFDKQYAEALLS